MRQAPHLKRSLSLPLLILYGLGTTIGAGIYALIGKVAGDAGLYTPFSFLLAAGLAGLTGLSFAELSSRYPKSAGEALYVREGLGSAALGLATGLSVIASGIVSSGAVILGATGYLGTMVSFSQETLAIALVLVLAAVAAIGISESVTAACILTVIEIGGLGLIVWQAAPTVALPPGGPAALLPPLELAAWSGLMAGGMLAFYAFIGFEDMVNIAEEVIEAPRRLPQAIVVTLVVTAALYLVLAAVAVLSVPPAELAASPAPLAMVFERAGGAPQLISAIAILATVNGALIQIIMASRVVYGLAAQGSIPRFLASVNPVTRTPLTATGIVAVAILVVALLLPIEALAKTTSIIILGIFTLVNLALIRLKRRGPAPPGAWTVPLALPVLACLANLSFLLLEALRFVAG